MKMINETFNVAALFHCHNNVQRDSDLFFDNTLKRQTVLGCKIVQLIQFIHGFNVSYVYQLQDIQRDVTTEIKMYSQNSTTPVDFYVRPMSLRADVLALARPVGAIFDWDFGFTISYPDMTYRNFYSKPFTRQVWNILYGMALFCSIFFYLLKRWENRVQRNGKWECSYGYELLMVVGAYCQHIPPIEAHILSRRAAYFVFFIFAYVVYTYYTSNLLSHLVNDTDNEITLQELLESDIECVVLQNVKAILNNNLYASQINSIYKGNKNLSSYQKLFNLTAVSMKDGLAAVKTTKTALLSDYVTIAPYIRKEFTSNGLCNIAQIDVVVNLKKYFFVSKSFPFPYLEQFKVSILRLKEAGILSRQVARYYNAGELECSPPPHVVTQFLQILHPLSLLIGAHVACLLILAVEIWYYNRYRVLPYVN